MAAGLLSAAVKRLPVSGMKVFTGKTGSKLPVIQRPEKECVSWLAFPCPRLSKLPCLLMYKFMPSENLANIKT